jgi:uncharacterized membrane protein
MKDIQFLRIFNFVIFSILFLMGIIVFFAFYDHLDGYMKFATMVTTVLIPLVVFAGAGSTVKKLVEKKNGQPKPDEINPLNAGS